MIEKLFEGCENLGWSVSEDQDAGTVELESYSPAGENLVVTVEKRILPRKSASTRRTSTLTNTSRCG